MNPSAASAGQSASSSSVANAISANAVSRAVCRPPPLLSLQCTAQQWRSWRQLFESYSVLAGMDTLSDERRKATIITVIGLEALELYNTLPFQRPEDCTDLKKVLDLLECHFVGRQNVTFERFQFYSRQQRDGETFEDYVTALRRMARSCEFEKLTPDEVLKDRLVCGVRDEQLRKSLLQQASLTLEKCLEAGRASEIATIQATALTGQTRRWQTSVNFSMLSKSNICEHEARGLGRSPADKYRRRGGAPQASEFAEHC